MAVLKQSWILVCWILLVCDRCDALIKDGMVILSEEEQMRKLMEHANLCDADNRNDNVTQPGWCPRWWDKAMCWPPTRPDHTAVEPCPNYVHGFRIKGDATRHCNADGTWFSLPDHNTTWTNYTLCYGESDNSDPEFTIVSKILQAHVANISTMYLIGYSISLVSLILAVIIMLYFRKLHCPRNILHINLFISLILRAIVSLLRELLFVNGVGFEKDIERGRNDYISFKENDSHWECKLLMSLFNYALSANYIWIFMEGLYLHTLIFVSVFSERSRVHWYMICGWSSPLLFIVPWILCRLYFDDSLCWNTWHTSSFVWIIKGPIAASIIINFVFFLNILRVLFTKLRATNAHEARKYRKLAKSTLVLIPLFGVPYIVFLGLPGMLNEQLEIIKLYFEMFFSSIQGLLVAILFCFLNGEVKYEIKRWWRRLRIRHGHFYRGSQRHSAWNTSATYVTRNGVRPSIQSNASDDGRYSNDHKGDTPYTSDLTQTVTPHNGQISNTQLHKSIISEENACLVNEIHVHNDCNGLEKNPIGSHGDHLCSSTAEINDVTNNGVNNDKNSNEFAKENTTSSNATNDVAKHCTRDEASHLTNSYDDTEKLNYSQITNNDVIAKEDQSESLLQTADTELREIDVEHSSVGKEGGAQCSGECERLIPDILVSHAVSTEPQHS